MTAQGDSYFNPVSRTRLVFTELPADNGGTRLVMDWFVAPGETLTSARHYHAGPKGYVSERFDLIAGSTVCRVGETEHRRDAPHIFEVPCNTAHVHPRNVGTGEMHVRQTVTSREPDMHNLQRAQRFFETLTALAQQGKVDREGNIKNPLQSALTIRETLLDPTWLDGRPQTAQRLMLGVAATLARALGYTPHHQPQKEPASAG
ncbi:hypothetical protein FY036_04560 [Mesorhizobium microcysteis]|uniref:Cupin domain-containing protein n=1 Tax=Neoaquamicrobium microcysteis TaxID=2682781 RepID=A0A5D4H3N2_9HYPH|nr:hypothetical protein [Mesorhizobium microcysteis]TYR34629.1 hypothetical protein FY036_04560 [Mesorhizobium microcysteis]